MKITTVISLVTIIIWALLTITQVWVELVTGAIYLKITLTAAIIVVVSLLVGLVINDYHSEKKMKDDGYLDS